MKKPRISPPRCACSDLIALSHRSVALNRQPIPPQPCPKPRPAGRPHFRADACRHCRNDRVRIGSRRRCHTSPPRPSRKRPRKQENDAGCGNFDIILTHLYCCWPSLPHFSALLSTMPPHTRRGMKKGSALLRAYAYRMLMVRASLDPQPTTRGMWERLRLGGIPMSPQLSHVALPRPSPHRGASSQYQSCRPSHLSLSSLTNPTPPPSLPCLPSLPSSISPRPPRPPGMALRCTLSCSM